MKYTSKVLVYVAVVLTFLILYNTVKIDTNYKNSCSNSLQIINKSVIKSDVVDKPEDKDEQENILGDGKTNLKYILQWTSPKAVPFVYMGKGQKGFIEKKCPYTNCFVTADRNYLGDYSKFHVIAFAGPEVIHTNNLPKKRSPHQKYVFATIESADNYPVCNRRFDGYFNWTWTYKLDSQVRWGYLSIRDKNNVRVGPNKEMHWIDLEDMDPVTEEFRMQLKTKSKAAAWFVSNCNTKSRREHFVKELKKELEKYAHTVDVYGLCGDLKCSRGTEDVCDQLIKDKYYFYLSFENSFSEDYATEKLLHALNNNAIPIVYGGANYTRFMPNGIYLDARKLGVKKLAAKMHAIINQPDEYPDYFRWKNHYSYHRLLESVETDTYCLFCTTLNDENMVKSTTVYKKFRNWWDPPGRC